MSRYKDRQGTKAVGPDDPNFVDTIVPLGDLVTRLHEIYEFHSRRGITPERSQLRRHGDGAVIRWWFANRDAAQDFASEFCGTRMSHL
jgi:hypothetical protein